MKFSLRGKAVAVASFLLCLTESISERGSKFKFTKIK